MSSKVEGEVARQRIDEAAFAQAAKSLRYLIADATSNRKSLRKLLSTYQVGAANIDVAESFSGASDLIKAKRPHVIFADQGLDGPGALALVEIHKAALEGSSLAPEPRIFILGTQKDSNAIMSGAAEECVDGLLLKPFTFDSLTEVFVTAVNRKINPSAYEKAIQSAEALLRTNQAQEAQNVLSLAAQLDPKPSLACFWSGQALERLGKPAEAIQSYERGLSLEPDHYRCLLGLLDVLMKSNEHQRAYDVARKLAEKHTVPLKQIPTLIRLSIQNLKFDDVLAFYKDADKMLELDVNVSQSLAAGLVVCGIWMIKHDQKDKAVDAFRKAEVAGRGNAKILLRILVELVRYGMEVEWKAMMSRVPEEVRNAPEVRNAELESKLRQGGSPSDILQLALEMIQKGIADAQVYEIAIAKSRELGRKDDRIEDLVAEARAKFPELADTFKP